ncbi:MAG: ATP-binding cassette domain-containing protein [Elusimicrobia bacterium]|nr:ATP-binding cassette domain-containing protein [Elusimicrobiota bacterium]
MNTTKVRIWRQSLACVLAALVVLFSPGLSCYTAFAGPVEAEGTPVEASIGIPGAGAPALNSVPVNLQIPALSGQDNPALDLGGGAPAGAPQALPARAAGRESSAPEQATSAESVKNTEAREAVEQGPSAALLPQDGGAAAPAAQGAKAFARTESLAAAEKGESSGIAKQEKAVAAAHGADAQRKFLKALYDGIIPNKEERGAAVASKSPAEGAAATGNAGRSGALSAPSPNSENVEQPAEVPQPAFSKGRNSLGGLWARKPSLRVLARHFLETLRDPRMIVYLSGLAATATAWAMHVPLAVTGILAAGTGAARGVFLAHKPKIGNFAKKALWRQGALLAASAGLYFTARSLSSDASLLLYAFSGTTAAVGLSPLAAKTIEIAKSIKESLVWISKFWGRIGNTGIKVKKQLAAASILAIGTSALSLIPPRYYGNMFQHLKDLLPAAAASHPAILHMYLAWGGVMLASYAAMSVLNYFLSRFMYDIGNRMMAGLSNLFYEHVAKLPLSWHKSRPVGDVISTGTDAIYNVQSTATMVVVDTVKDLTLLIPSLAVMFYASWQMSLILLPTLFLALALPSSIYGNRSSEAYKWFFRDLKPRIASHIEQTEVNSETIKSAGKEDWEIKRTRHFSHKTYIDGGEALARVNAPYRALSGGLTNFVQVGLVIAAALAVHAGVFTIPMATFYYFAANYSRQAVQDLCDTYVQLKSMKGSAAKFDKIMADQEEDYRENAAPLPPSSSGRAVAFDHVSFGYRPSQPVLKEITLSAKPGQMIALVGESGSGKTTVTRLMLGLLKPTEGSVRIDGRDLSEINIKDLRSRVGTILQDPVPFDESMAYNIKYFKPEATEEQVMEAAKAAGFHDDIARMGYGHNLEAVVPGQDLEHKIFNSGRHSLANKIFKRVLRALIGSEADKVMPLGSQRDETDRTLVAAIAGKIVEARKILLGQDASAEIAPAKSILDNIAWGSGASFDDIVAAAEEAGIHDDIVRLGYNSRVGERGANLSGGQKQKLLLARLFLSAGHPWDIMILDEPTAALDGVTQQKIQDTLEARRGKTTVVMVAHRLSTVQAADKIVVFGKGAILEQGTHEELLRKNGVYAKLWEAQKLLDEAQQQPAAKP